jgi:hypothetical protein
VIARMTISEATADFCAAASAKGDLRDNPSEDHALHHRMATAFRFLASQGPDGRAAFAALLWYDSPHVRAWVPAQLLSEGDAAAVPVAEHLTLEPGLLGFSARITLEEFRAGRLRSPFVIRIT